MDFREMEFFTQGITLILQYISGKIYILYQLLSVLYTYFYVS